MREKAKSIMGMNILVTGYGRIANILSRHLQHFGANVTIVARKVEDLVWARIAGMRGVHFDELEDVLGEFDTIVNTVPAQIFDKVRLAKLQDDCLLVDVATKSCVEGMELSKSVPSTAVKVICEPFS